MVAKISSRNDRIKLALESKRMFAEGEGCREIDSEFSEHEEPPIASTTISILKSTGITSSNLLGILDISPIAPFLNASYLKGAIVF
jgi:hypothetical protein